MTQPAPAGTYTALLAVLLAVIAVMLGIIAVELLAVLAHMRAYMRHQKQTDVTDVESLEDMELKSV